MSHEEKSGKTSSGKIKPMAPDVRTSRVSFATPGPRVSQSPYLPSRASSAYGTDFEKLIRDLNSPDSTGSTPGKVDFRQLTTYFMGFWKVPHAAAALGYLERLEIKRTLKALQKKHGFWYPPADVVEALKIHPKPASSHLPDSKHARNLKFVLKILGCSLHEDKPYKQFLRARTLRQKQYWLYKYQGQKYTSGTSYTEPICPTRLKRLYQFFPNNFTDEDGFIYFNNKVLSYDENKNIYYIGRELDAE